MQQDASDALSNLDRAFAAAVEHNQALMESAAGFLRAESFRFLNRRADSNRAALERLAECRGVPGMLTVQKDWLGDLMQDYAALGQRQSELWQQSAEHLRGALERQLDTARQTAQAVMEEAMEVQEAATETARQAAADTANGLDEARQAMTETVTENYQPPAEQMH